MACLHSWACFYIEFDFSTYNLQQSSVPAELERTKYIGRRQDFFRKSFAIKPMLFYNYIIILLYNSLLFSVIILLLMFNYFMSLENNCKRQNCLWISIVEKRFNNFYLKRSPRPRSWKENFVTAIVIA